MVNSGQKFKKTKWLISLAMVFLLSQFIFGAFSLSDLVKSRPPEVALKLLTVPAAKAVDYSDPYWYEGMSAAEQAAYDAAAAARNSTAANNTGSSGSTATAPEPEATTTESVMARVIIWLCMPLIKFIGGLLAILIKILLWLMRYNGFVVSSAVKNGWVLVRDISNLFFVVILLAIAIGTILRVESYNFKKLLPKVLIMAVLVNFSRTICGLIIDAAQVVMMTFAAAFAGAYGEKSIIALLNLDKIVNAGTWMPKSGLDEPTVAVSALLAVVLLLVALVAITVYVAVLMMRIVYLWLLVIFSPIAYIAAAFPQGMGYAKQWWQEFGKYVIVGPMIAFNLWLAFSIAGGNTGDPGISPSEVGINANEGTELSQAQLGGSSLTGGSSDTANDPHFINKIGGPYEMVSFIIAIAMLFAGLMMINKVGVAGGNLASNAMSRMRQLGTAPFRGAWRAAKGTAGLGWKGTKAAGVLGLEVAGKYAGVEFRPWVWKEGWEASRKKHREERETAMKAKAAKRGEGILGSGLANPEHELTTYFRLTGKNAGWRRAWKEGAWAGKFNEKVEDRDNEAAAEKHLKEKLETFDEISKQGKTKGDLENDIQEIDLNRFAVSEVLQGNGINIQDNEKPEVVYLKKLIAARLLNNKNEAKELRAKAAAQEEEAADTEKKGEITEAGQIREEAKEKNDKADILEKEAKALGVMLADQKIRLTPDTTGFEEELGMKMAGLEKNMDDIKVQVNLIADIDPSSVAKLRADLEAKQRRVKQLNTEIADIRPEVNYALRRDQRAAINEEKKNMTTDSWQELFSMYEDAERHGDLNRMGAAFTRLTETANENEAFNMFGYDSHAAGLRDTTYMRFVGKKGMKKERAMQLGYTAKEYDEDFKQGGMSEEQALALASDVSYIAEKNNHSMVMRAVGVKDGRQYFQSELEREKEQQAEVRKMDFETYLRRANRLAFGYERPKGETRQERADNFRKTGEREFFNAPVGLAFFRENWPKFAANIPRGRFNISWAINLTSKTGRPDVEKLIGSMTEREKLQKDVNGNLQKMDNMWEAVGNFAGEENQKNPTGDLVKLFKVFYAGGKKSEKKGNK